MGGGRDVQSKSAPFGIGDAFVLTPSEFCLPGEYFVDAEEYPLASDVGISSPLHVDVGFDEPEGGTETSSATETTEPVVGVDPSLNPSSMEPKNGLEASGGMFSERVDSSKENKWANRWSREDMKQWQAEDPVTRVVIDLKEKGSKPVRNEMAKYSDAVKTLLGQWERLRVLEGLLYIETKAVGSGGAALH